MNRFLLLLILIFGLSACDKLLDLKPKGVLSASSVGTPEGAEKLVVAAYSQLGNDHYDAPYSLWPYGNVRADDAYKGGRDESDGQNFHFTETFVNSRPDNGDYDAIWYNMYVGVARANTALQTINSLDEKAYPLKKQRIAEMRFLRGHFYFMLKILFKNIPVIDETVPSADYAKVFNRALSNEASWQFIADDFKYGTQHLPATQEQVGRATQAAAYAYWAKAKLYQAYRQDENHSVTTTHTPDLDTVVFAADRVVGHQLEPDYAFNFLPGAYMNGPEAVFSIQFSTNDQTLFGRLNWSDILNVPQGLGCCDFHKPSQNLVNAFKTDATGLPLFDTFNEVNYRDNTDNADPRLDHTVAMPGHPWKYNTAYGYTESWNRNVPVYGVYASMKENVSPDCDCFVHVDPFYGNSKNRIQIRYADVLLWKAEALIELGRHAEALPLINQLRERSKNSVNMLVNASGQAISKFKVEAYVDGANCTWTQDFARKALRFERRLEFAMEGSRFFDLVRWGVAAETLNGYIAVERTRRSFLGGAAFTKGRNEYLPIPLSQMNFSQGLYKQNPGY